MQSDRKIVSKEFEQDDIDKLIQSNNVPDRHKESLKAALIDNILELSTIRYNTRKNLNEFSEILSHLSIATTNIEKIKNLNVDGFLKSTTLAKDISAYKKQLSENKALSQADQKNLIINLAKQIKDLDKIYDELIQAEKEQQDAYTAYIQKPFTPDMFAAREKEYQDALELFRKRVCHDKQFASDPEMLEPLVSISYAYFRNLGKDEAYSSHMKEQALRAYNAFQSLEKSICKDFSTEVNGTNINMSSCKKTIEMALGGDFVINFKNKLKMKQTIIQTNSQSTSAVVNNVNNSTQPKLELKNNTISTPIQSSPSIAKPTLSSTAALHTAMPSVKENKPVQSSQIASQETAPQKGKVLRDNENASSKTKKSIFSSISSSKSKAKPLPVELNETSYVPRQASPVK